MTSLFFFSIFKAVRSAMIFLSQLVLSRTALNQRFYFISLKLSSKKMRTGLYGSYDEDGLNSAHLTTCCLKLLYIQCCRFTPMWLIIARRLCHRDPFSHARLMTLLEYGTLKKVMIISVLCKVLRILCFTIWFLLCLILISWFCLRI